MNRSFVRSCARTGPLTAAALHEHEQALPAISLRRPLPDGSDSSDSSSDSEDSWTDSDSDDEPPNDPPANPPASHPNLVATVHEPVPFSSNRWLKCLQFVCLFAPGVAVARLCVDAAASKAIAAGAGLGMTYMGLTIAAGTLAGAGTCGGIGSVIDEHRQQTIRSVGQTGSRAGLLVCDRSSHCLNL